jgi:Asp-tRNA(Asn)/Glu-tRNA(Gln) amidotransferase A subunit family amidase
MAPTDLDLCFMTATEAVAKFRSKELSPVDVMRALVARSEEVNRKLNVLTYAFYDRALEQAKRAEAMYAGSGKGKEPRPLEGVAVAIKDFHSVAGEITTYGSKIFEGFRPEKSAPTVDRLLDAGAILLSRTTTPEFAHSGVTKSPLWGVSRNPWNPEWSCGGSSGGAGAAVAAGMTTLADGTDGGGSIRIPSCLNGVFGYKPPFGRNPLDWEHPLESLLHYGPIVRSVADGALMQNVMSGAHPADICSLREEVKIPDPSTLGDLKGWKVALSMDLGYFEVDEEVQANTRAAAKVFESLGATVEEVDLGWNRATYDAWLTTWEGLFAGIAEQYLPRWRYEMSPFVVKLLEAGQRHSAARFYRCNQVRGEMYWKLAPILDSHRILICPTTAAPGIRAEHQDDATDYTINGKPRIAYVDWAMTYPFNLLSQCPVANLPSGFARNRIPTGIQVVAKTYDDLTIFQASAAYERANPWRGQRPKI